MSSNRGFSKNAILQTLNNLLVVLKNPSSLKEEISEKRLKGLRNYARELLREPLLHVDQKLILPEELTYLLVCCAFFVHHTKLCTNQKIPMGVEAKKIFDKIEDLSNLPDIDVKCPSCKHKFTI